MFNISLQINGDGEATEPQARAVIAALVNFYGPGIIPASYEQVGQVAPVTIKNVVNVSERTPDQDGPAPDGHPMAAPIEHRAPIAAGDIERDKDGIPWDERIHAGSKTKTQAGIWTRRRNLDDATFDAVMAELRAANTARTMEAAQALSAPAETSAAEAFTPPASVTIPPATVPAPPAAAVPTPPAATPAATPAPAATGEAPSFVEIMKKVTTGQSSGKLTQSSLQENLAAVGLDGIAKLATADAGTRAAFAALIDAALA